jgi:uncharacterized protein (DUF2147 family)
MSPDHVIAGLTRNPAAGDGSPRVGARGRLLKAGMTALLLLASGAAFAQSTPIGLWRSIDDKTGEAKAEIRITDNGGVLTGRIEKLLKSTKPNPVCEECTDDRRNQPIQGLEIIRGVRKAQGKEAWDGGKVLDPENGKEYNARLTPIEGGRKLEMRGSFGPFGRTQTWVRVQ